MKAVLEFAYPEDEQKLQHAMHATEYYEALEFFNTAVSNYQEENV